MTALAAPPAVERRGHTGRLTHALSHELRVRIVEAAHRRRTVSAVELAAEFGVPISNIAYHVRRLCALRMLELDHETRSRGAVCRHYRLSSEGQPVGRRVADLLHALDGVLDRGGPAAPVAVAQVAAQRRRA